MCIYIYISIYLSIYLSIYIYIYIENIVWTHGGMADVQLKRAHVDTNGASGTLMAQASPKIAWPKPYPDRMVGHLNPLPRYIDGLPKGFLELKP